MKRNFKLFAVVGIIGLLLSSSIFALFPAIAEAAAPSATWVDQSTLRYNGSIYKENDGSDDNWHFYEKNSNDRCADQIDGLDYSPGNTFKTQNVNYKPNKPVPGGGCSFGSTRKITLLANPDNFRISFVWIDNSNIKTADGSRSYSLQSDGTFKSTSDGDCADYLKLGSGGDRTRMNLYVRSNKGARDDPSKSLRGKWRADDGSSGYAFINNITSGGGDITINRTGCHQSLAVPVRTNATNSSVSGTPEGKEGQGTNGGSCEALPGGLNWFLCPVIELLDSAINALDNAIQAQLTTPDPAAVGVTKGAANCPSGNCLKDSWGRIRNVALIILVPIMLVMVIGTAIGFQGLDAYTVKRAMPRLIIAVIFISLSWYITVALVNITNAVGAGVYGLLTNPFGLADKSLSDMISAGSGAGISGLVIFGGLLAIGVGAISIGIVLSLAVSAALALFIGFAILVLRNVFIYAMILLAPVAILAWIFPNNDRLWKLWWGTFSKLLLMFPMIMALIASGKIFASIIPDQQGGGSGLFTNAAIVIAYIAPYFFIPATFKFAGGVFANIAGVINDRGRGAFDRLSKGRQEKRTELMARNKAYGRFSDRNRLTRGLNMVAGGMVNPNDLRRGRRGIRAGVQTGRMTRGGSNWEADKTIQDHKGDDQFLLALADEDLARQKISAARATYDSAVTEYGADSTQAQSALAEVNSRQSSLAAAQRVASRRDSGTRLQALNALAQTGFQFAPGDQGYQELSDTVRSIVGNDDGAYSNAMNTAQYFLRSSGRAELGGINQGTGAGKDGIKTGVRKLSNYQRGQGKTETYHGGARAWLGSDAVDAVTGKTSGDAGTLSRGIERSLASGDTTLPEVLEWHSMLLRDLPSATDANKLEIQKQISAIEQIRGTDPGFAEAWSEATGNNRRESRAAEIPESERDAKK